MGKSTISTGPFSSSQTLSHNQRISILFGHHLSHNFFGDYSWLLTGLLSEYLGNHVTTLVIGFVHIQLVIPDINGSINYLIGGFNHPTMAMLKSQGNCPKNMKKILLTGFLINSEKHKTCRGIKGNQLPLKP